MLVSLGVRLVQQRVSGKGRVALVYLMPTNQVVSLGSALKPFSDTVNMPSSLSSRSRL